jgi:hypothetical protein
MWRPVGGGRRGCSRPAACINIAIRWAKSAQDDGVKKSKYRCLGGITLEDLVGARTRDRALCAASIFAMMQLQQGARERERETHTHTCHSWVLPRMWVLFKIYMWEHSRFTSEMAALS